MDLALRMRARTASGDLLEDRLLRLVVDLIDRIEAQTVEAILLQPVERVSMKKSPHRRLLVGDGGAPRRLALGWKKSGA